MTHYRAVGEIPRTRHIAFRDATGRRYIEELMGQQGFASRSALLYHRHSPAELVAIETIEIEQVDSVLATPDLPLVPRHLRTGLLDPGDDLVVGRRPLLANADVCIAHVATAAASKSPLYRNAVGDELVYIQAGTARLESVFGALDVRSGDYVVVPASATHRWVSNQPCQMLVIESRGHVEVPARYLSAGGQFLEHAPYCERDLRAPVAPLLVDGDDVPVVVRTSAGLSRHVHRHHPFDVVGWDGALYPWALSIHDFQPIVGRVHQPPPVHQTFAGPGFVICSFVPRLYDFHPDAVKVPYHHANTDSDEVLFYSAGNFMSRAGSGIDVGSISFHPAGFIHGPQPGSYEASVPKTATEELAVMVDTFAPLGVTSAARTISDSRYPWTWHEA
ncbi:MAG TPA: homogentisate 1,2-dioxygenase [Ilumatobacteraceae bacterium]|nr:homogentisate 1,2-dioxygenase [Ilumatobacteraceae bacterium]